MKPAETLVDLPRDLDQQTTAQDFDLKCSCSSLSFLLRVLEINGRVVLPWGKMGCHQLHKITQSHQTCRKGRERRRRNGWKFAVLRCGSPQVMKKFRSPSMRGRFGNIPMNLSRKDSITDLISVVSSWRALRKTCWQYCCRSSISFAGRARSVGRMREISFVGNCNKHRGHWIRVSNGFT